MMLFCLLFYCTSTIFPVIVAVVLNFFFKMDFSQPAQPTARTILPVWLQLKGGYILSQGGYNHRKYGMWHMQFLQTRHGLGPTYNYQIETYQVATYQIETYQVENYQLES